MAFLLRYDVWSVDAVCTYNVYYTISGTAELYEDYRRAEIEDGNTK